MRVRLLLIDPQNSYSPCNVIDIQRHRLFSGFNRQPYYGKCGRQIMSIEFFLQSETQQRAVFQDVSSQENISTPEQSQQSDSMCKGIKILCRLQFS